MTQKELILEAFKVHGGKMTLGQILTYMWGYEARSRFAEMRKNGYKIDFKRGERPSENLYTLHDYDKPFTDDKGNQVLNLGV